MPPPNNQLQAVLAQIAALKTKAAANQPQNQSMQERASWDAARLAILNLLPSYAPELQIGFQALLGQIDAAWTTLANTPDAQAGQSIRPFVSATLTQLLDALVGSLQRPPATSATPSATPTQPPAAPRPPDAAAIRSLLNEGVADQDQQVAQYVRSGYVAFGFGIVLILVSATIPFTWHTDKDGWPLVLALLERLLAIAILVPVAVSLIRMYKEQIQRAARVKEIRAAMKMMAAVEYFGDERTAIAPIVQILQKAWPEAVAPAKEEDLVLPHELIRQLPQLLKELVKK